MPIFQLLSTRSPLTAHHAVTTGTHGAAIFWGARSLSADNVA